MRILFITDSLALPREKPEKVLFDKTYVKRIKSTLPNLQIEQLSIGGATIDVLHQAAKYYVSFYPDVVILQSGIVDCAPRSLTKLELQILKKIPLLGKILLRYIRKNERFLRKIRKLTYTNIRQFEGELSKISGLFPKANIWGIAIMPCSSEYELLLPGISANVAKYNEALGSKVQNLLGTRATTDWLMSDHHHLNEIGHQSLANEILEILKVHTKS